jgi:hypothetical protein
MRASSHVLYLLSIVESTEPKQVYGVKLDFVSERTTKDHHHPVKMRITNPANAHAGARTISPGTAQIPPFCGANVDSTPSASHDITHPPTDLH